MPPKGKLPQAQIDVLDEMGEDGPAVARGR